MNIQHRYHNFFNGNLSVITNLCTNEKYFIGKQLSVLLNRQTYNLYRCFKKKNIKMIPMTLEKEIDYLKSFNAISYGTHRVTYVPFNEALCYIADIFYRQQKKDKNPLILKGSRFSYFSKINKIHRRKPLPWNIHRSIKKQK